MQAISWGENNTLESLVLCMEQATNGSVKKNIPRNIKYKCDQSVDYLPKKKTRKGTNK